MCQLATFNTLTNASDPIHTLTRQGIIAMLSSKLFTASPVILYPAKLTVEPWIENEDVPGTLDNLPQAGARALEVLLCQQKCSRTASAPQ